jgi:galactokinase
MQTARIIERLTAAGMSEPQAIAKAQLFQSATDRLHTRGVKVTDSPHAFYVPGRIEFLGKHTDYAGGRSLICAVDRGFCIVAFPRSDSLVRVVGETFESDLVFPLESGLIPNAGHWSNYPMTVGRRVARNFPAKLTGADIAFTSDLPASSGLSSSSALIISFFLPLSSINRLTDRPEYKSNIQSPTDLAGYLGTIENGQTFGTFIGDRGVGTFGGSEDHTAIMLGVAGRLSQYSFCPVRLEKQVPLPADYSLVIGVSDVVAEKTGAAQEAYNNASFSARAVLSQWHSATGRSDSTLAAAVAGVGAEAVRKTLHNDGLINRFDQFIAESAEIIPAVSDALIAGEINKLGPLIDRSQHLAETLLKNQVPETIYLAKSARQCGAVAASSFGAGFGGSVWAMVRSGDVDAFIADWKRQYQSQFPESGARAAFLPAAAGVAAVNLSA